MPRLPDQILITLFAVTLWLFTYRIVYLWVEGAR